MEWHALAARAPCVAWSREHVLHGIMPTPLGGEGMPHIDVLSRIDCGSIFNGWLCSRLFDGKGVWHVIAYFCFGVDIRQLACRVPA